MAPNPLVRTPREMEILEDLAEALKPHSRAGTFACGGSIEFESSVFGDDPEYENGNEIPAIDIRYGKDGKGAIYSLPDRRYPETTDCIEALIDACKRSDPGSSNSASANKNSITHFTLDKQHFLTSFCPYKAGIIDAVAQGLLSQILPQNTTPSIRAELRQLDILTTGGKIDIHTNKPSDDLNFGTLIVCLPLRFHDGALVVRHENIETDFDLWCWNTPYDGASSQISWAAFYNDCEYYVEEVTLGHRLTFTYDLYSRIGQGHLAGRSLLGTTTPSTFPFDALFGHLPRDGRVFFRGRVLGIWLTHSYAHTNKHSNLLPGSLKGVDLALYEGAQEWKRHKCLILPVITIDSHTPNGVQQIHYMCDRFGPFLEGRPAIESPPFMPIPKGKITWVNTPPTADFKEPQLAFVKADGTPQIHYSRAAMFIRIPPYPYRTPPDALSPGPGQMVEPPLRSFWDNIRDDGVPWGQDPADQWYDDFEARYDVMRTSARWEEEDEGDQGESEAGGNRDGGEKDGEVEKSMDGTHHL